MIFKRVNDCFWQKATKSNIAQMLLILFISIKQNLPIQRTIEQTVQSSTSIELINLCSHNFMIIHKNVYYLLNIIFCWWDIFFTVLNCFLTDGMRFNKNNRIDMECNFRILLVLCGFVYMLNDANRAENIDAINFMSFFVAICFYLSQFNWSKEKEIEKREKMFTRKMILFLMLNEI